MSRFYVYSCNSQFRLIISNSYCQVYFVSFYYMSYFTFLLFALLLLWCSLNLTTRPSVYKIPFATTACRYPFCSSSFVFWVKNHFFLFFSSLMLTSVSKTTTRFLFVVVFFLSLIYFCVEILSDIVITYLFCLKVRKHLSCFKCFPILSLSI